MIINYSNQEVIKNQKAIFLAGPTPRDKNIISWRTEALKILADQGFDGVVYIPENSDGSPKEDYVDQAFWEREALSSASVIAFWIPREISTMPAFTTNVEFGYWINRNKIIYGRPQNARKIKYLDWLYDTDYSEKPEDNLENLMKKSIVLSEKQFRLKQNTTSLEDLIARSVSNPKDFYTAISLSLTPIEKEYMIEILKGKTCLNCTNGSCNASIAERYTIDDDNNQAGYNCLAWNNEELIGKAKVLKLNNLENMQN